ncbi:MAG: bifunctional metallophosphatase/5'-nucleotidase, partial [Myxococcales bacterium]
VSPPSSSSGFTFAPTYGTPCARAFFSNDARAQGVPYVGANVKPLLDEGGLTRPFVLVRRQGVTVGVIGLSTRHTPESGMRDNYKGLHFGDEERALVKQVPAAYAAGADVVVVIGHICAEELRPIVARHPDWRLALAGGGHCHRAALDQVFATPVVEPGAFLRSYGRVTVVVDPTRRAGERLVSSRAELVDLTYDEGAPAPIAPDPGVAAAVAGWQTKTDAALGEVIGHTDEALEPDTPPLVNFLTDRWRESAGADVAILNRYGTRQALGPGPISLGTIYSVLPFDNKLVKVKLSGSQLLEDVRCCGGHVSGLKEGADRVLRLSDGRAIEPGASYTVVVTDYTYFGGSGFLFEKQDPQGVFGEDWRPSLIRWLKAHPTSPGRGLEKLVDREARLPKDKNERR